MNIDKLKDRLDEDITKYKSFFIDAPWGIGKTTFIKKYFSKDNYIYLSLFGIVDAKELEDNLFLELKNKSDKLNKICQFYEPCNIKTYSFKNEINALYKDKLVIILDDIEKKSDVITYKDIFGLVKHLNELDFVKVILLCDSNKIGINNLEIFNSLKSLVIDKNYVVTNISKETLSSIIKNNKKNKPNVNAITEEKYENYLYSFIDKYKINNIRTINNMITFSGKVINNLEVEKMAKGDIQTLVNIAFSLVVEKSEHYNYDKDHYIKVIVSEYLNNITYPLSKEELVEMVINIYEEKDNLESIYKRIEEYFNEIKSIKYEKKNVKLFYLSGEKIEKKIMKFIKNSIDKYNPKYTVDSWYNELYEYYFYSKLVENNKLLNEEDVINIMDSYVDSIKCEEINLFNLILRMQHNTNKTDECLLLYKILKDKIVYKYFMYYYENTINSYETKEYNPKVIADLITFILGEDFKNSDDLDTAISLLRSKSLFIPDLSNEIDDNIWEYVHEIWKGITTSDESQSKRKMINLLIQVSNDIYQRTTALGKYRISTLNEYYNILK